MKKNQTMMRYFSDNILGNLFHLFLLGGLMMILSSCRNELQDLSSTPSADGETITITGTLAIPDMGTATTRASETNYLTVMEFDKDPDGDATMTFLSHIYKAKLEGETFQVTFNLSDKPKVLHFILAKDYVTTNYGSEATLLPSLSVSEIDNGINPAYWGKLVLEKGYEHVTTDVGIELKDALKEKFQGIKLLRNHAQVTVASETDDFEVLGFNLINVPTSGTIVPWDNNDLGIASLLNADDSMKPYSDISQYYSGIMPGKVIFRNTEDVAKNWTASDFNKNDKDIYEHPYESSQRTYVIVYGKWKGGNATYYKVDLGKIEINGDFTHFNIIRNIKYNVKIKTVTADGCSSVAEAISKAPFNNLVSSTETKSMLSISDGENMFIFNAVNHIIVAEDQTVEIRYGYKGNGTPLVVDFDKLEKGQVIKSKTAETVENVTQNEVTWSWHTFTITSKAPTPTVKSQEIKIVDGKGLGQIISLTLRNPYKFAKVAENSDKTATVANGTGLRYPAPVSSEDISNKANQPFTVYFNLPDGLPESLFPLKFQLESEKQGIENNKQGNLVVSTGPSLFNPNMITISYIKTVSYNEYRYQYVDDGSNNVDTSKRNDKHTIRCRFNTITEVASGSTAKIKIHNSYFSPDAEVEFNRKDLTVSN